MKRKCKNVSGQKLKQGSLVAFVKQSRVKSFMCWLGLKVPEVELCQPNNINHINDWYVVTGDNECSKSGTVHGVDTSEFDIGETIYLNKD